ncbi:MAG TPA: hypothetical protein VEZ41_00930 [Allosphingosinicella sp.]|jgi:hypothetical protein|nr:hypothetical protein [Allosphingosinicella sp.]
MRDLYAYELKSVSGGCDSPSGPCHCPTPDQDKKAKRNNGFGNGADADISAPGGSGKTGGGKEGSTGAGTQQDRPR